MKHFIKVLSLLLVLMMLEASLNACADIQTAFGANGKGDISNQSGNGASKEDESKESYLEFPSNNSK